MDISIPSQESGGLTPELLEFMNKEFADENWQEYDDYKYQ